MGLEFVLKGIEEEKGGRGLQKQARAGRELCAGKECMYTEGSLFCKVSWWDGHWMKIYCSIFPGLCPFGLSTACWVSIFNI